MKESGKTERTMGLESIIIMETALYFKVNGSKILNLALARNSGQMVRFFKASM